METAYVNISGTGKIYWKHGEDSKPNLQASYSRKFSERKGTQPKANMPSTHELADQVHNLGITPSFLESEEFLENMGELPANFQPGYKL